MDGKALSKMIRMKKKKDGQADVRQDMDYAGQNGVDPNVAWDEKQAMEVNDALDMEPEMSASEEEMGENDSSQDKRDLKKAMARIQKYIDSMD